MEGALYSCPLLVHHNYEQFCSGLLVRGVVGCTHWYLTTMQWLFSPCHISQLYRNANSLMLKKTSNADGQHIEGGSTI